MHETIAIVGPTCSGKTAIACELAHEIGGELVNLDKISTYRHFPIGIGSGDCKGVRKHLYEILEPDQELIPAPLYAQVVRDTCADITARGNNAIIEGGSMTYFPPFFALNSKEHFCKYVFCLPLPENLTEKIQKRMDKAFEEGLLEEVSENSQYTETFLMRDAHAIVPLLQYVEGKIGLTMAKREIQRRATIYAHQQTDFFKQYDLIWLEQQSAVKTIIEKLHE